MPLSWKLFHPVSVLLAVVGTILVLVALSPMPTTVGITLAFASFLLIGGLAELVRRTWAKKAKGHKPLRRKPHAQN